jgi:hypothetical protein
LLGIRRIQTGLLELGLRRVRRKVGGYRGIEADYKENPESLTRPGKGSMPVIIAVHELDRNHGTPRDYTARGYLSVKKNLAIEAHKIIL